MGLRCSCGVMIEDVTAEGFFDFHSDGTSHNGIYTITAFLCVNRPEDSTFTLQFMDTDGHPERSFSFELDTVTKLECVRDINNPCLVTLEGMGKVSNQTELILFQATFLSQGPGLIDLFEMFSDLGNVQGGDPMLPLPPGSIICIPATDL